MAPRSDRGSCAARGVAATWIACARNSDSAPAVAARRAGDVTVSDACNGATRHRSAPVRVRRDVQVVTGHGRGAQPPSGARDFTLTISCTGKTSTLGGDARTGGYNPLTRAVPAPARADRTRGTLDRASPLRRESYPILGPWFPSERTQHRAGSRPRPSVFALAGAALPVTWVRGQIREKEKMDTTAPSTISGSCTSPGEISCHHASVDARYRRATLVRVTAIAPALHECSASPRMALSGGHQWRPAVPQRRNPPEIRASAASNSRSR